LEKIWSFSADCRWQQAEKKRKKPIWTQARETENYFVCEEQ